MTLISESKSHKVAAFWGIPVPFPDELYWGYLGRVKRNLGILWARTANRHLFGLDDIIATAEFSGFTQSLCEHLAFGQELLPQQWLQNHTLYPYYLAFASTEDKQAVMNKALHGSVFGLHQHLSVSSGLIKPPVHFRYCPNCWREQLKDYGEVYLGRLFQLPGVLLCPTHACLLVNMDLRYRNIHSREFLCVSCGNASHQRHEPVPAQWVTKLMGIGVESEKLLDEPLDRGKSISDRHWQYRLALKYMGFGKGAITAYEQRFINHYPMPLLAALNLSFIPGKQHHWLREMVRSPRRRMHPLQHILFRQFVEAELGSHCWETLGYESWPCFSRRQQDSRECAVFPMQLKYHAAENRWRGLFQCTCGCRYSAGGTGRPAPYSLQLRKLVSYGSSLDGLIQQGVLEGLSKSRISQTLGVDVSVIERTLNRSPSDGRNRKMRWECSNDRQAWLSLRERYPHASLKELRQLACALYTRMYHHDRSWLALHQPQVLRRNTALERVDWSARDTEFALRVDQEITRLLLVRPMRRVTMTSVGRHLGVVTLLKHKRAFMPKTAQVLRERCESVEHFQERRLQTLIHELRIYPRQFSRSALLRMAGLNDRSVRPAASAIISYFTS
jgi:hypothetical protein